MDSSTLKWSRWPDSGVVVLISYALYEGRAGVAISSPRFTEWVWPRVHFAGS